MAIVSSAKIARSVGRHHLYNGRHDLLQSTLLRVDGNNSECMKGRVFGVDCDVSFWTLLVRLAYMLFMGDPSWVLLRQ